MLMKQIHGKGSSWKYGEVYDIGEEELERMLASGKQASVMFYAPWCPHCRQMKPIYKQAAKSHKDMLFAMVDCDKNPNCAKKHNVRAFPACNMYKKGKRIGGFLGARPTLAALNREIEGACSAK
jgi:thioredoxin-like negative regulator of GroEL